MRGSRAQAAPARSAARAARGNSPRSTLPRTASRCTRRCCAPDRSCTLEPRASWWNDSHPANRNGCSPTSCTRAARERRTSTAAASTSASASAAAADSRRSWRHSMSRLLRAGTAQWCTASTTTARPRPRTAERSPASHCARCRRALASPPTPSGAATRTRSGTRASSPWERAVHRTTPRSGWCAARSPRPRGDGCRAHRSPT